MKITHENFVEIKAKLENFEALKKQIETGIRIVEHADRITVQKERENIFTISYSSNDFLITKEEYETLIEVNISLLRSILAKRQNALSNIDI